MKNKNSISSSLRSSGAAHADALTSDLLLIRQSFRSLYILVFLFFKFLSFALLFIFK